MSLLLQLEMVLGSKDCVKGVEQRLDSFRGLLSIGLQDKVASNFPKASMFGFPIRIPQSSTGFDQNSVTLQSEEKKVPGGSDHSCNWTAQALNKCIWEVLQDSRMSQGCGCKS